MIEKIPNKIEKSLKSILSPNEIVLFKIKGAFKEALICTSNRVIILKSGFMTGQLFGTNTFQLPYKNIAGVEVKFHLISGYFELSAGGMQNTPKSYWSRDGRSPAKSPNCISLTRKEVKKFQDICTFIMSKINEINAAPTPHIGMNEIVKEDIFIAIEKLGKLKDSDLISEDEFQAKKSELLARI